MHRVITGYPLVDHINGDGLDNRRANLRAATATQNNQNRRPSLSRSGFKGVTKSSKSNGWYARIRVNGKLIHLGCYPDPTSAARAYDAAALEHFGEFAWPNFRNEEVVSA